MKKFIARKKTVTKTVAVLKNADAVFFTYSANEVKTQGLMPKGVDGENWLKSLIPDITKAFDGELYLPSGYRVIFRGNKLFIKHIEDRVHIWKISKK